MTEEKCTVHEKNPDILVCFWSVTHVEAYKTINFAHYLSKSVRQFVSHIAHGWVRIIIQGLGNLWVFSNSTTHLGMA